MFKGYDVRGIYGSEVTEEKFSALGEAYSSFTKKLIVGMDYREHNPSLFKAFASGFPGEISFIGNCPTACVSYNAKAYGMQVTASHNPAEYAGAKFIHERHGFFEDELSRLGKKFEQVFQGRKVKTSWQNKQKNQAKVVERPDMLEEYIDAMPEIERGIFDLGGGAACALAKIFPETLFAQPDPKFERRAPEPREETLGELKKKTIEKKELGFAFDGDADRVMVAAQGKIVMAPTVTAFLCEQNFKKGDTMVLNIEFSQESREYIRNELGMKVITCPVGTKHVVTNVLKNKAALGAEPNGHYYIPRHVPDSDGIYAAALLAQATSKQLVEFSKKFKNAVISEAVMMRGDFEKIEELMREGAQEISTMDGVRAVYEDYTLLVRASHTEPKIRITCEAPTNEKARKGVEWAKSILKKCAR